jgi:general secretion pathway protein M
MTALRLWFEGRSLRERRLLAVMLVLAVVTLVWAGLVRPVRDGLSSTRERYGSALTRLGETEAAVAAIRGEGPARPLGAPLADTIRARADQAGFVLASLDQESPGRVRASIQAARPQALTRWLASLERAGVLVEQATLTDKGDRSVSAALVLRTREP